MGVLIVHKNYWRLGSLGAPSSQHPQFPNTDSQIDTLKQSWRTRYGTGTGNGKFVVTATNKYICFDEGGAEMVITLAESSYNGQTLCANIKYWLDAAGALTYTVTYDEGTAKFTIAATGNFTLRWNTGTYKTVDCSDLLGFSDTADDTGAATYTADYRRIHYSEEYTGQLDAGSAVAVNYVAILGHNLSSAAVITLHGGDDSSWTNETVDTITWASGNIYFTLPATRTKRIYQVNITDPTNPNAYIEITTIVLGLTWSLSRGYVSGYQHGSQDASVVQFSDSLVAHAQEKPRVVSWALPFRGLNAADKANIDDFLDVVGISHGFILCLDSTAPATNTYFVQNTALARPQASAYQYWDWALEIREVQ